MFLASIRMITGFTVRPYITTDLPQIMAVYLAAVHELGLQRYSPEEVAAWAPLQQNREGWRERMLMTRTYVAECGETLAGFLSFQDSGFIEFLFTNPRFARRGVATMLYARAEGFLRHLGVTRIKTQASLVGELFFSRQGFVIAYEEKVEFRGVKLRRYVMHKDLE